jgi:hypothetical protein
MTSTPRGRTFFDVNWKIRKIRTAINVPSVIDSEIEIKGDIPVSDQRSPIVMTWGTNPARALYNPKRKSFSCFAIRPKI